MPTSNYALRLPASLKKAAEEVALEDGATLNQFIVTAVAEKVSALKTADYFTSRASRADATAAMKLLRRAGGQPPAPDDMPPSGKRRRTPVAR